MEIFFGEHLYASIVLLCKPELFIKFTVVIPFGATSLKDWHIIHRRNKCGFRSQSASTSIE